MDSNITQSLFSYGAERFFSEAFSRSIEKISESDAAPQMRAVLMVSLYNEISTSPNAISSSGEACRASLARIQSVFDQIKLLSSQAPAANDGKTRYITR
jgi:hypothetical protein